MRKTERRDRDYVLVPYVVVKLSSTYRKAVMVYCAIMEKAKRNESGGYIAEISLGEILEYTGLPRDRHKGGPLDQVAEIINELGNAGVFEEHPDYKAMKRRLYDKAFRYTVPAAIFKTSYRAFVPNEEIALIKKCYANCKSTSTADVALLLLCWFRSHINKSQFDNNGFSSFVTTYEYVHTCTGISKVTIVKVMERLTSLKLINKRTVIKKNEDGSFTKKTYYSNIGY